jgi:hypothetical protein
VAKAEKPNSKRFVQEYPAATAVGLTGLSALIVWLLSLASVEVPVAVAATIGGLIVSIGLLIARYGIKGIVTTAWKGTKDG